MIVKKKTIKEVPMAEEINTPAWNPKVVKFSGTVTGIEHGAYCISNGGIFSCRDQFQNHNKNLDRFFFVCKKGTAKNVAAFINCIEKEKMGHTKLSEFGPTDNDRVMWVAPAKFWQTQDLRRSLFSALLRAGINYDGGDITKALESVNYLKSTLPAVEKFIAGNTWYTGSVIGGWHDTFRSSKENLNNLGKKPISEKDLWEFALKQLNMNNREELEETFRKAREKKK